MALSGSEIQGISSLAVGITGLASTIVSTAQSFKAARSLMESARDEAVAVLDEGDAIKSNAQQKAFAAMRDISYLEATTDANKRALDEQGRQIISHNAAHAAGSGIRQTGSSLYVEADTALQFERAKQNQDLTRLVGTRRFQFMVDQQLEVAQGAQPAAQRQATALLNLRSQQAGNLQFGGIQNLNQGIASAGKLAMNKGTKELFDGLFPKGTKKPAGPQREYFQPPYTDFPTENPS